MDPIASREIMWNVHSLSDQVFMYLLMVLSIVIAMAGIWSRFELWSEAGKPGTIPDHLFPTRLKALFTNALLQRKVVKRRPFRGFFHTMIYFGFMVLLFTTTMVFIDHDFGIPIYQGDFYLGVTVMSDVFGFGLLIGVVLAWHRRYAGNSNAIHTAFYDSFILLSLGVLTIQGFALEALRIHATNDPWALYSPVGYLLSLIFWPLSEQGTKTLHYLIWWFHTISVFAVLALLPYTKFFHIITSSAKLYFEDSVRPKGQMAPVGDIETLMETEDELSFGTGSLKEFSFSGLLDLDACTSCGRCQEVCPAYVAEQPLSPKWVILDTRNHALAVHSMQKKNASLLPGFLQSIDNFLIQQLFLPANGLSATSNNLFSYRNDGVFRGSNKAIHQNTGELGGSLERVIPGDVIDKETFWSCTTCRACVDACPVGISPMEHILESRRHMALMEGDIPSEAANTLRSLENRGNPYGPREDRPAWAEGLEVRILEKGDKVDYLYWVGCVSSFDKRKQKIARSMVKIMNSAGLSFGILGKAECCSGDPARRLGEENLFQTMAKENIGTLRNVQFTTLVSNCPHCFNTISNEYPEFGEISETSSMEIIHHSVLIKRLLSEDLLSLNESTQTVTFHDPCYLGRYNDEYDAPRQALKGVKGLQIIEMEASRQEGMCCGAGGGHFWMDLKNGKRINSLRVLQAQETGAETIATGCPFCMQMLEDGIKTEEGTSKEMDVRDIAEIIAEQLITP